MKNLTNTNLKEKKILLRVDLNVPVVDGKIIDKSRIDTIRLTVKKLQEQQNKVFLISHFGRPKGKIKKEFSLKFICPTLKKALDLDKIFFLENLEEEEIRKISNKMSNSDVCLVENIRFYPEEEKNNLNFAKKISKNFDIFVNDAFSASHRIHASIVGFPKFLPSYAGYSLIEEIKNINIFMNNSKKPNLAIIGGSKISTKINLFYNLIEKCDAISIGGAMANTFLSAMGINVGLSLHEKDLKKIALSILEKAKKVDCKILLPLDLVCANNLQDKININQCNIDNILSNQMALDIGCKTTKEISSYILKSKAVLWNGPLGAFEYPPFDKSSVEIAKVIKRISTPGISTIAGGGDTISVIKMAKAQDGFSYISKAGGAFLEWLEGKSLPGIEALKKK
jgi:phosphoglycerate kinase